MSVYGGRKAFGTTKMGKFLKNLRYSDEVILGVGVDRRSSFTVGDVAVAYHRFGDTVSLGLGAGLVAGRMLDNVHYFYLTDDVSRHYAMKLYVPLFVRVKASPWRFGAWQPFGRLDVGGMVGQGGGLFFDPAVGTNWHASAKVNLFFALSTLWMQTGYLYDEHLGQPAIEAGSSAMTLMLHAGVEF